LIRIVSKGPTVLFAVMFIIVCFVNKRYFTRRRSVDRESNVSSSHPVLSLFRKYYAVLCIVAASIVSCAPAPPDPVVVPQTVAWQSKGQNLLEGLAACGFCHGESRQPKAVLAGGLPYIFASNNNFLVPNITSSPTGVGNWDDEALARILRGGEAPSGRSLHPQAHKGYEWLSTPDLFALVSYLRTVPAIAKVVPQSETSFWESVLPDIFEDSSKVVGYVPESGEGLPVVRGKYLVDHVARCGSCHNGPDTFLSNGTYLGGGQVISHEGGEKVAPDISGSSLSGVGSWTETDFVKFLQIGVTAEGRRVDSQFCPIDFYQRATLQDISDIATYLHRIKP
jgi:hypothetical protein